MRKTLSLLALAFTLAACDQGYPVDALSVVQDAPGGAPVDAGPLSECNDDLREIVAEKAENAACHAECAELFVECLDLEAPQCFACEHEAATCRSTCAKPYLWSDF